MIAVGARAPAIDLEDQFGRKFSLADLKGKRSVLLLFYPYDFTPTCSREVPSLDMLADSFLREANTVVAAVSCDSRFAHAAWGHTMGGVRAPMLADCNPRGRVAKAYGAWSDQAGTSDRATVIIDCNGVVRHASSVGIEGERDIQGLLELAKHISAQCPPAVQIPPPPARPPGVGDRLAGVLFVSSGCGHSRQILYDLVNLKVPESNIARRDILSDATAASDLALLSGDSDPVVPTLIMDGQTYRGRGEIEPALVRKFG